MSLTAADRRTLEDMRQRQLHLKRRQRATETIQYRARRHRSLLAAVTGLLTAAVAVAVVTTADLVLPEPVERWFPRVAVVVLSAVVGVQLCHRLLRSSRGRRFLARYESRLRDQYTGDLHSGRKWLPFYYRDEDISPYVPQILSFIEQEGRFDSVDAALAFAKSHHRASDEHAAHSLEVFRSVADEGNVAVVSTSDEHGRPSSRLMRFVKSGTPGVWYLTTAPHGPKVRELDLGRVAVITPPTAAGAVISSNRVAIRRAPVSFPAIAGLYRDQVPGYADGMTDEEQEREVVYELTLRSAKVDTWTEADAVEFDSAGPRDEENRPGARERA